MSAFSSTFECFKSIAVRMPTKSKKTLVPSPPQPPTEMVTFSTANGPTADIDSNRGAADQTEMRGGYQSHRSRTAPSKMQTIVPIYNWVGWITSIHTKLSANSIIYFDAIKTKNVGRW